MRILDLCCCAGGSARGLFDGLAERGVDVEIVGVDIHPQPRYPFTFVQEDALCYLRHDGHLFDFIWASFPCQRYTRGRATQRALGQHDPHPDLIAKGRELLKASGKPWIMENVEGSPLQDAIRLCGQMFDLRVLRHRLFESPLELKAPAHQKHTGSMLDGSIVPVYGAKWLVSGGSKAAGNYHIAGAIPKEFRTVEARLAAMEIDWMNGTEVNEAIPPSYSRYLSQFIPVT